MGSSKKSKRSRRRSATMMETARRYVGMTLHKSERLTTKGLQQASGVMDTTCVMVQLAKRGLINYRRSDYAGATLTEAGIAWVDSGFQIVPKAVSVAVAKSNGVRAHGPGLRKATLDLSQLSEHVLVGLKGAMRSEYETEIAKIDAELGARRSAGAR
jgi:hypothetical protein